MKPSFALNFTDDSIGLLHRTSRGWLEVGSVPLDEPDLGRAVAYLRGSALGLEPRGITTKLVIPNSQIRYMTLKAPGPDAASRRAQIKTELEGRTPYAVEDLVFDWWGKGQSVQVAVVARETLEEAEAFARENRLNPLSFVAVPEPGDFGAEPWFGASAMAGSLLAPGEKVDRDQDPLQITGRAAKPEVAQAKLAEADATEESALVEEATPKIIENAISKEAVEAAPIPAAVESEPEIAADLHKPVSVIQTDLAPEPKSEVAAAKAAPLTEFLVEPQSTLPAEPVVKSEFKPQAPEPAPERTAKPAPLVEIPTPSPTRATPLTETISSPKVDAPPLAPPVPKGTPVFDAPVTSPIAPPSLRAVPVDAFVRKPPPPPRAPTKTPVRHVEPPKRASAPSAARLSSIPGGGGRGAKLAVPVPEAEWPLERVTNAARMSQGKGEPAHAPVVTAPSIPMQRERRLSVVPSADPAAGAEAAIASRNAPETRTVFGTPPARRRGKPRFLGLILTIVLLLLLAAVAAWSSLFVASSDDAETPVVAEAAADQIMTPQAVEPVTASVSQEAVDVPSPSAESDAALADPALTEPDAAETSADDEMIADGQDPEALDAEADLGVAAPDPAIGLAADANAGADTAVAADPAPNAEVAAVTEPAAEEVAASIPEVPAIESATVAPPDTSAAASPNPSDDPQDEIFLTMVDPTVATSDAVALAPPAARTDTPPPSQPAPPAFGTLYKFDAEGLIIPTPEGVITPEGVRLVAGPPPRIPPERPAALAETPADPVSPAINAASTAGVVAVPAAEPAPFPSDPALAGARPRLRPAELVQPTTAESGDDAALRVTDTTRMSSLKPRARPAEILASGEAQLAAADQAMNAATTAAVQAASASLVATPDAGASQLAVAVSRKPAPRPKDFSPAIETAVSVAAAEATLSIANVAAAAPVPAPEPTPAPQPEVKLVKLAPADDPTIIEQDEPEVTKAAPSIPTRASVAKQATFKNALNLGKTSLIGVYGTASNRYAYVRQDNGRFVKVEVGDRVDGGRVAAISDRELHYIKNGQTVTLKMPKG